MDINNTQLLENKILSILQEHPNGITEHDLIKNLQDISQFPDISYCDNLSMFQNHFILFNVLYKLRRRLLRSKKGVLKIHTLEIILSPYQTGFKGLISYDPLEEYYLDITNLEETSQQEVDDMLNNFWTKYLACEHKTEALSTFNLAEPVTYQEIKSKYKKLVVKHHPDCGGSIKKIQDLNRAMEILNNYYNN